MRLKGVQTLLQSLVKCNWYVHVNSYQVYNGLFRTWNSILQAPFSGVPSRDEENLDKKKNTFDRTLYDQIVRVVLAKFLGSTWRRHFVKSKTKEPPKLLSSEGMRGGKLISVSNFSAEEHASSGNNNISVNFRVMELRDIQLWMCLSKNIYLSRDF